MKPTSVISDEVQRSVESTVRDLVRVEKVNGACFVNLPMLYPDGSFVTVRIDQTHKGLRVSDAGFAYREIEDFDGKRSFRRVANGIAESLGVEIGDRIIFTETVLDQLHRSICDVAEASWRVADQIWQKKSVEDDAELTEGLTLRLKKLFGDDRVSEENSTIVGASTTEWEVSAVVSLDDHKAIFQVIVDHANSINKASTAFRDLSQLEPRPRLVGVVKSKQELGSKLALLAPAKIIEEAQPDEIFMRAAA